MTVQVTPEFLTSLEVRLNSANGRVNRLKAEIRAARVLLGLHSQGMTLRQRIRAILELHPDGLSTQSLVKKLREMGADLSGERPDVTVHITMRRRPDEFASLGRGKWALAR